MCGKENAWSTDVSTAENHCRTFIFPPLTVNETDMTASRFSETMQRRTQSLKRKKYSAGSWRGTQQTHTKASVFIAHVQNAMNMYLIHALALRDIIYKVISTTGSGQRITTTD